MGIGKGYCIEQDLEEQIVSLKEVIAKQKETIDRQSAVVKIYKTALKQISVLPGHEGEYVIQIAEAALKSARETS